VFEKMVLRIIFGPKREKVAEGWRKLHNDELHNLYATPEDEMGGTCSTRERDEKCIQNVI